MIDFVWHVDDGYVGDDRPQTTGINDEDFDNCVNEQEVRDQLYETIRDYFEENISPAWKNSEEEKVIERWKARRAWEAEE